MAFPNKRLEQIAFNTRCKIPKHMVRAKDNFTHEQHLSETLQTSNKQLNIAVTFRTGYTGIFNVTNENIEFISTSAFEGAEYNVISKPSRAYEVEPSDKKIERML